MPLRSFCLHLDFIQRNLKSCLEERKPKQGTQAATGVHTHTTYTPPSTVLNILLRFAQFPILSLSILRGWLFKKFPGYFKLLGFTTYQRGVLLFPFLLYKQVLFFPTLIFFPALQCRYTPSSFLHLLPMR